MKTLYRNIDLPIDDSTLPDLEHLTKEDILSVVRLSASHSAGTRIINRLHNKQKERKGQTIKAHQLVNSGFEPMAQVQFMLENYDILQGQITNAVHVSNGDSVVITIIAGQHVETSWYVDRNCDVKVWPKEVRYATRTPRPDYDKVMEHGYLNAGYIAEHLTTFFGKYLSVKNRAGGVLREVEVKAADPDAFYFLIGGSRVRLDKDDIVDVKKETPQEPGIMRPGPYPWAPPRLPGRNPFLDIPVQGTPRHHFMTTAYSRNAGKKALEENLIRFAEASGMGILRPNDRPDYQGDSWWYYNNRSYVGKTVQLGSGDPAKSGVKGVCSQITYENGKLIFVIDGLMYKRNRHTVVKVWDKKEDKA